MAEDTVKKTDERGLPFCLGDPLERDRQQAMPQRHRPGPAQPLASPKTFGKMSDGALLSVDLVSGTSG